MLTVVCIFLYYKQRQCSIPDVINTHFCAINVFKIYTCKYLDPNRDVTVVTAIFSAGAMGFLFGQRLMRGYKYWRSVLLRGCENAVAEWFYVQNYSIIFNG